MKWLELPETKNIRDLDDPSTTLLHGQIIRKKKFLSNIYLDFYGIFKSSVCDVKSKTCVELGSGGGFIKEVIPNVLTSDILKLPDIDRCFSVLDMPFEDSSVDAFFMIDVLHHVPDAAVFLSEMNRCLKPGGKIIMIEPANTLWGRFIYQNFHHEPFEPNAGWTLPGEGPLSSANGALPWIIFQRDRNKFEADFPSIKIRSLRPHTPFRYLLSGGVSKCQLIPGFMYGVVRAIENFLSPLNGWIGMFQTIELEKT